jgi:hypothetical protein
MRVEGKSDPSSTPLSIFNFQPSSRASLAGALSRGTHALAKENRLYLGTSSWKYEGWLG